MITTGFSGRSRDVQTAIDCQLCIAARAFEHDARFECEPAALLHRQPGVQIPVGNEGQQRGADLNGRKGKIRAPGIATEVATDSNALDAVVLKAVVRAERRPAFILEMHGRLGVVMEVAIGKRRLRVAQENTIDRLLDLDARQGARRGALDFKRRLPTHAAGGFVCTTITKNQIVQIKGSEIVPKVEFHSSPITGSGGRRAQVRIGVAQGRVVEKRSEDNRRFGRRKQLRLLVKTKDRVGVEFEYCARRQSQLNAFRDGQPIQDVRNLLPAHRDDRQRNRLFGTAFQADAHRTVARQGIFADRRKGIIEVDQDGKPIEVFQPIVGYRDRGVAHRSVDGRDRDAVGAVVNEVVLNRACGADKDGRTEAIANLAVFDQSLGTAVDANDAALVASCVANHEVMQIDLTRISADFDLIPIAGRRGRGRSRRAGIATERTVEQRCEVNRIVRRALADQVAVNADSAVADELNYRTCLDREGFVASNLDRALHEVRPRSGRPEALDASCGNRRGSRAERANQNKEKE